ncbi:hypothetical protein T492DRAFT_1047638 [Pavlovales sp. CCMP2436]|nr:hypothetical protein T492DRAFT_1047638 [Pavlovales sp. CCMP2436]|mmetsp:Transcript_19357/g.48367  ORF Transcript_19357/g.48367 Transcript_19357/m.48367 type:complete len:324 (-) Transcript_19357:334-1305(-)
MLLLALAAGCAAACAAATLVTSPRAVLITGANKGQGFALAERCLAEQPDAYIFLCARDRARGADAAARLHDPGRVEVVEMDVVLEESVRAAALQVASRLAPGNTLHGIVSNAGILWENPLASLVETNTFGMARVLDGFLPLLKPDGGRVVIVSSGMGPLILGYADEARRAALLSSTLTWAQVKAMADECLAVETAGGGWREMEKLGFDGGPFRETARDFHYYGLSKMFADAYMRVVAAKHPRLFVNSLDPGLVFTDLIAEIPRFAGKSREEAGAATPNEGVEPAMRLLFGESGAPGSFEGSGRFYAMSKDRSQLLSSTIDKRP